MQKPFRLRILHQWIAATCCLAMGANLHAQELNQAIDLEAGINRNAAESQQRVSDLARQTDDLLAEYRTIVRETESLKQYNNNLQRVVTDQYEEAASIDRQLAGLEETNRSIVPLMIEMIEMLDQIVEADIPFRLEERRETVQRLNHMMAQSEVTVSEKYRQVMEAYQAELEYGRTTEAYVDQLPGNGQSVEFLRVGRTLLVYQTADREVTGWFNPRSRVFEPLPDRYRQEVRRGLAIARNERAPDLVVLPVPAPELAE